MLFAHCGSLFLDPRSLSDTATYLTAVERVHRDNTFSPAATMEAVVAPLREHH